MTVFVAITAEAPQTEVPAAISSASRVSTPSSRPAHLVKTKVAARVTEITASPGTPTARNCSSVS